MTQLPAPPQERPSFGARMWSAFRAFVRALFRLALLVLIIAAIVLGAYQGIPLLYNNYVLPLQQNTRDIGDLRARQDQTAGQVTERLNDVRERIDQLEVVSDQDKQTIAELQTQIQELEALLVAQQGELSEAMAQSEEQDEALQQTLDSLSESLGEMDTALGSLEDSIGELAGEVDENRAQSDALALAFADAENPINTLRRELQLVKAMELITRSRLFLSERNLGLLEQDLLAARELLLGLQGDVLDYQEDALTAVIERLDLALGNLPDELDLAENDLEVAWQLLVDGLPSAPPEQLEAAGTPTATPELTPAPDATPTVTPTASS